MLKEARIILPVLDNDGNDLGHVHAALVADLEREFGGLTIHDAQGSWEGQREAVTIYDIAVPWPDRHHTAHWDATKCDDTLGTLLELSSEACFAARQECVYLRLPNGAVAFVKATTTFQTLKGLV